MLCQKPFLHGSSNAPASPPEKKAKAPHILQMAQPVLHVPRRAARALACCHPLPLILFPCPPLPSSISPSSRVAFQTTQHSSPSRKSAPLMHANHAHVIEVQDWPHLTCCPRSFCSPTHKEKLGRGLFLPIARGLTFQVELGPSQINIRIPKQKGLGLGDASGFLILAPCRSLCSGRDPSPAANFRT